MTRFTASFAALALLGSCATPHPSSSPQPEATPVTVSIPTLEQELVAKHGEAQRARIHRGLTQVASLWRPDDGDLAAFAREQFIAEPSGRTAIQTFERFERIFEALDGHANEMQRELRWATDVDVGPQVPVDGLFGALDPSAHLTDDLFASKVAFVALLNFPLTTLEERTAKGRGWSRREWAEARLTSRFQQRIPASVQQEVAKAGSEADTYINGYNVWMHHVVGANGERLFPKGLRLISHWNLRDEIKADYSDPKGLEKQRAIVKVMERIVTQSIPKAVIDNPRVDWDPFANTVKPAPDAELEADAPQKPATSDASPEPDTRYARLFAQYLAAKKADPFTPATPTAIDRSFAISRELPEARVKALLEEVLSSPLVPKVAAEIQKRLGRPLEPHDLWFNGFMARAGRSEAELDALTRQRYPTAEAFAKDIPRILEALGFSKEKAAFVASHVAVDPSRGAGHAMPALRRGDLPRLRTRVEKGGMDYKGYNIAVHELGHNVEQVFSLYEVDHTLLSGVPNSAFTEALAFVFQSRDLELLGLKTPDASSDRDRVLNDFWNTYEIAGVSLVDIAVWHWMYAHPDATPSQLREATLAIARETWDRYFAPVLGGKGSPLLGIYSHMVAYPLYLCDYPLGHVISFQIEEKLEAAGAVGPEFERMAKFGSVMPDLWMENATGAPVSAGPLLKATERALSTKTGP